MDKEAGGGRERRDRSEGREGRRRDERGEGGMVEWCAFLLP